MEASSGNIKHGWVWLFCLLIFFFNTVQVLPEGLTLTAIMAPLWLMFLYREHRLGLLPVVFTPFILYLPVHFLNGVYYDHYFKSLAAIFLLVLFITAFSISIRRYTINFNLVFKDILILNFFLTLCSLALLFIPSLKELVWYMVPISRNIEPIPRLKLFTSEASHYSFLLAPVAIFFFCRILFFKTSGVWAVLAMIIIPLALSFSLGVLLGLLISGLLIIIFFARRIFFSRRRIITLALCLFTLSLLLFVSWKWFPGNPLFHRISNIFKGDDTSARGRTYEAFMVADKVVAKKSRLFGIGPGQLKIIGRDIIIQFYFYSKIPQTIRIPNAMAETVAYYGYLGAAIRLIIEILLFFRTRVYRNPYRLWLFLFVFIYQFTGSYITNIAEYIVWVLAFCPAFDEFLPVTRKQELPVTS
jgi:hypothetical protein